MPFTSKIARSIQSLTSNSHSRPSYSFLAAEERKLMLRQQQAIKIFEPVPNQWDGKSLVPESANAFLTAIRIRVGKLL